MTLSAGTKLGPYEILSPLGTGGMGEVYRAKDTRLKRDVAVKVLPDSTARNPEALSRFQREAEAVAALSHPNILAIHDVGTHEGVTYVVVELLEGATLRERIRQSAMGWRKAVELGIGVADGLAAAHAKGIVHRDLKPENIFITSDGSVKILDFGLAKTDAAPGPITAADSPTRTMDTKPGTVLGTLHYMAPEQVRGLKTDARSDIFSLGCVLYEMVTGDRAFSGDTAADVTTAILKEDPPSLVSASSDVGPELDRTISRCLEKSPQQRFHAASDLAFTLRTILSDSGKTAAMSQRRSPRMGAMLGVMAGVMAVMIAGFVYLFLEARHVPASDIAIKSLAVLPLEDLSGKQDEEYFADGMTDALITKLAQIAALRVTSRASVMRYKGSGAKLRQIAHELNDVDAIVTASFLRAGDQVRITARLIEPISDRVLWTESYQRDSKDILAMQADVARAIADEIRVKITPEERKLLASAPQVDPAAYDAYVRGMELVRRGTRASCQAALSFFDQALKLDPDLALAYAGRAEAYNQLGSTHMHPRDTLPAMKQAADMALALDENLPEAHIAIGYYRMQYEWDWKRAGKSFERALEINRNHAEARLAYAMHLTAMNRLDEGMAQLDMVFEANPAARHTLYFYGGVSFAARRFERTIRDGLEAIKVDPNFWPAHQWIGLAQGELGRFADAIDHLRTAGEIAESPTVRAMLGAVLAMAGKRTEAKAIREDLRHLDAGMYVCPYEVATISIGLGEYDEAFDDMYQACDDRAACIPWLQVDPRLDPIRDDPRFDDLLERVGFEPQRLLLADRSTRSRRSKLVVLPFDEIGPSSEEWFSEGMTEEINATLGRLAPAQLGVVSRTSAVAYKNTNKSAAQIGRELDVDHLVEGTVRRSGDRFRITVKLIRTSDQTQLWTQDFNRSGADVFGIQSDVARRIARSLALKLLPENRAALDRSPTADKEAHEAYLKGQHQLRKDTVASARKALEFFGEAIQLDPDYALAYAARSDAYRALETYYLPPREVMPQALEAAVKALDLDDTLAEAHASLAYIKLNFDWDWQGAERGFKRALDLNPSLTEAHLGYARFLVAMDRDDEAIAQLAWAREYDPNSEVSYQEYGLVYYMARRYDDLIEYCRRAIAADPGYWAPHKFLGLALAQKGEFDQAIDELKEARRLENNPAAVATLGTVYAQAGRRQQALMILDALDVMRSQVYVCPYRTAAIYVALDEYDKAFELLGEACDDRSECMPFLKSDPRLDPIRDDPRFIALLDCVGLEHEPSPLAGLSTRSGRIKLAVLPFEDMSSQPEQWFTDGMTEEMITQLGRLHPKKLGVIGRTSAMRYKRTTKSAKQIGRELDVQYLVEGGVRRAGARVRITVKLIEVRDETQLWAESYERDLSDIFAIQADVAKAVAQALAVELLPGAQEALARTPTSDSAAYEAYLRGRHQWNRRTGESLQLSIGYFDQAIQADPTFALAHVSLANAYVVLGGHHFLAPLEAAAKARHAATRALELDPSLGEAHTILAVTVASCEWKWEQSLREYRRAIALNPNHATAHQWYAETLVGMGRFEDGLREIEIARELDPLSPIIGASVGWFQYFAGRSELAVRDLQEALAFEPNFAFGQYALGEAYLEVERFDEAIVALRRAVELSSHGEFRANLARAYALAGQTKEAREMLDELIEKSRTSYVSAYLLARIDVALGMKNQAIVRLNQACDLHDWGLRHLRVDPAFDELRDDPRFVDILRRIRLEP